MYLAGYIFAALLIAGLSRKATNLALLSLAFACNAFVFWLLPVDEWRLLYAGMADIIMALLAILLWCYASTWVGRLALILAFLNFALFAWTCIDFWYGGYLWLYYAHEALVQTAEVAQLTVLAYFTPAMQDFHADRRKGEPPWKWMEMSLP